MGRYQTFGQKMGASFAILVALAVLMGVVAVLALRTTVSTKDRVIEVGTQLLLDAERVQALSATKGSDSRGYLLTADERDLAESERTRIQLATVLERLRRSVPTEEGRRLVEIIAQTDAAHQQALEAVIASRREAASLDAVAAAFDTRVRPLRDRLDTAVQAFVEREQRLLDEAKEESTDTAQRAMAVVVVLLIVVSIAAVVAGVFLTRSLGRQIGFAVGQIQSSSAELQAVSIQQATGAKEQATAMSEIATTMSELLATSRQITDSAQRVAQIADETAAAAESGGGIVNQAHESIAAIRRQVDLVVSHMLELGRKSQQIGTVLEIVSELAEQTNILAINATIEAAGAGEGGRRFGVVADEIRKLADRVTASTKEIRGLIDDVRSAVNTTVMATEAGSKAVDAGSTQFTHLQASFKRIVGLVMTTTEAAKEIELSIKQQMSAVEQVNVAIANIAQATRETEASTGQTQQTASQLAVLSKDLLRVVRPEAVA